MATGLAGCSLFPTQPKPVNDVVYVSGLTHDVIHVLDAETLEIFDSLPGYRSPDEAVTKFVVTPDGRTIFTVGFSYEPHLGRIISQVDLKSGRTVMTLRFPDPYFDDGGALSLYDNGKILIYGGCRGRVFEVDRLPLLFPFEFGTWHRQGPLDGLLTAGLVCGFEEGKLIRIQSMWPPETVDEINIDSICKDRSLYVARVALHPGGDLLSVISFEWQEAQFTYQVLDLNSHTVLYELPLPNYTDPCGPNPVLINPSGTVGVILNPGSDCEEMLVGEVYVIDLVNFQVLYHTEPSTTWGKRQIDEYAAFTSDERAIIVAGHNWTEGTTIKRISLETFEPECSVTMGRGSRRIVGLAVAPSPD